MFIIAIALVLGISTFGSTTSYAAEGSETTKTVKVDGQNPVEVTVLKDDANVRVIKTYDTITYETYTTTFNKNTQSMVSIDEKGTEVFNSEKTQKLEKQRLNVITPLAATLLDSNQDRTGQYKYYYYRGTANISEILYAKQSST